MDPGDLERSDETQSFQRVVGPAEASTTASKEAPRAAAFAPPPAASAPSGLSAVVVVHGMGQQIPFETLDAVVEGLMGFDQPGASVEQRKAACDPVTTYRRVGGRNLPRAELSLHARDGTPRRVHLYEAYWAPLTEGRVVLRDVIRFLGGGACNGVVNSINKKGGFRRWMFGGPVPLTLDELTSRNLALATWVLLSLVLINTVTSAIFVSAVLKQTGSSWLSHTMVADCTFVVTMLLAGLAVLMLLLLATRWMSLFSAAMGLIGLAGFVLLAVLVVPLVRPEPFWTGAAPGWAAKFWVVSVVWGVLSLASWYVRGKLVQYVGDVAVYVTPQTLDRFARLRQEIKDTVAGVVNAVYGHGADGSEPGYDRIAVVGHSLGSVAAYDALNAAINADHLEASGAWRVVKRTCLLLTFGSPLDKTAFIFKTQGHGTGETREALAAAVQPLIQSYEYRSFPWVNVWSPADIVSGSLEYYDAKPARKPDESDEAWSARLAIFEARRVANVQDPAAVTPLVAHTQYWRNTTIFEQLHQRLVG